jgi:carbon storage regulator CsrA
MLEVNRSVGEKIAIGKDITIEVVRIEPGRIKLGITAPKGVVIRREEVPPLEEKGSGERREVET